MEEQYKKERKFLIMNLTYKVVENGYEIYDNGTLWITQYEPFIPNKSLSYEDNARAQIEELQQISTIKTEEDNELLELAEYIADLDFRLSNIELNSEFNM